VAQKKQKKVAHVGCIQRHYLMIRKYHTASRRMSLDDSQVNIPNAQ
jgi:hypothetical protein